MKPKLNISAGAIFLLSALYFFGGFSAVSAVLFAALVHEFGHVAVIKAFGGKIKKLNFEASGLCLSYCGLDSTAKEAFALIMGPVFGLALAYAASYFGNKLNSDFLYQTAGISLIFSLFNLFPALPLDGGRLLFCLIPSRKTAEKVLDTSGMLSGLMLIILGLYFLGSEKGAALLLSGCMVLIAQTGIVKSFAMM